MPRTESVFEEFSDAKRKIQEVFEQIKEQIEAVQENAPIFILLRILFKLKSFQIKSKYQTFIEHVVTIDTDHVLSSDTITELNELVVKVTGVHEILSRDQMKVAFFGRTSNGKSTCINAMLWDKVLPSGIGHTTSCFLAVEGSGKPNPYIITEDGEEQAVEKVQKLAHALSGAAEKLTEDSLIKICWPKNKCRILNAEVCIVDSPGVDVTPDLDLWIDKHCLDADVFILVANAESTMMQAEKNFFHKVSECFSKPNIFILHNRWDASAQEPDMMDEGTLVCIFVFNFFSPSSTHGKSGSVFN
jgi:mitofusin